MLDHREILRNPDEVLAQLARRGIDKETSSTIGQLADERRRSIQETESLRAEQNQANQVMKERAKAKDQEGIQAARVDLKKLKEKIKAAEDEQKTVEQELKTLLLNIPNLAQETVPDGPDESGNQVERTVGTIPSFDFKPKPHWEIGELLKILNFEQSAKISGSRFAVISGLGAKLERALAHFMLDLALEKSYVEVSPPVLIRKESMLGAGQYPKFEGESFETLEREYVLIPTAEVPLVNLHQDEILSEADLPIRYVAHTPCFRREAGAAGKDTRGLFRQHQFSKVELVALTTPEKSRDEHERLTDNAEEVLKRLGLAYQVVNLCTGDLGFASSKTYDLEVWLPSQNRYREISSCSNCLDFQARRAQIRYRPNGGGKKVKPALVHTLNGSALALGRTLIAVLENYQRQDGSVKIPEALVPYFGAEEISVPD